MSDGFKELCLYLELAAATEILESTSLEPPSKHQAVPTILAHTTLMLGSPASFLVVGTMALKYAMAPRWRIDIAGWFQSVILVSSAQHMVAKVPLRGAQDIQRIHVILIRLMLVIVPIQLPL